MARQHREGQPLAGRRVVLGVCGGIAAYKAADVCRRLVDAGALVSPVMTADATRFLGEVTLSALATEPVRTSLWAGDDPVPHTRLGRWAEVVVVAPATARLLAAYAAGLSDDLLTATLLATRAPVVLCPAMHTEMWEHPAVRDNTALLRRRGVHVVEPEVGALAGGDVGAGRLPDPGRIVSVVEEVLSAAQDLQGLRVLVTAGGTREPLDPVRFLGNRSSGKQGHALAAEAAARGAQVTLVTASDLAAPPGVEVVPVETAAEMEEAVLSLGPESDAVIMAAAVADFRPKAPATYKLRRSEGVPDVLLEATPDILAALGRRKRPGQVLVGFAAETGDGRQEALAKLRRKGLDLVVVNDVLAPGAGFGHDTNAVLLLGADGSEHAVPLADKREVARVVVDHLVEIKRRQP
ncbi:MAG: bifunctional phosphopantothenoylcysteine decarboxylase/phosphopantothenate--cysteine ligase CoaBC [Actinomycetota bacterium]|nr:bifunctional phosphopantothenoylcysteine decarboxylase/phosphopantothenate--cysteine ligase CoaBC [Actinomycetota bacterium]